MRELESAKTKQPTPPRHVLTREGPPPPDPEEAGPRPTCPLSTSALSLGSVFSMPLAFILVQRVRASARPIGELEKSQVSTTRVPPGTSGGS